MKITLSLDVFCLYVVGYLGCIDQTKMKVDVKQSQKDGNFGRERWNLLHHKETAGS